LAKVVARVGLAANNEAAKMAENFELQDDPIEPYRIVIKAARPKGGASV
jgi:hypothetical protein